MFTGLSRKQAGVIYRKFKEGALDATDAMIGYVYDYTDMCSMHVQSHDYDIVCAYRKAVDAIFANDMDEAQKMLERAEGIHHLHYA